MRHSRYTIAFVLLLAAAAVLWPRVAHAGLFTLTDIVVNGVLTLVFDLLDLLHRLILSIINGAGNILQAIINLKVSTGSQAVYTAWRVLRDFCNMAFIIVLTLMAFGTIFDSLPIPVLKAFSINQKGVIANFLIAALLLNFSFAIGQVVIATSDKLTSTILTVMPKNLGAALAESVNHASTQINTSANQPPAQVLIDNVPLEGLSQSQVLAINTYMDAAGKQRFSDCLKNNQDTLPGCYSKIVLPIVMERQGQAIARQQAAGGGLEFSPSTALRCFGSIVGLSDCTLSRPAVDSGVRFKQIVEMVFKIFLASMLLVVFVFVIAMMIVRIPFLWVLLALSPLAWTSKAFPGSQGFSTWWTQFMAWNIFGPVYMGVIYFGMLLTQKMSQMTASLGTADGTVPLITGFIGSLFSYGVVAIVFIGGTAGALKISFAAGSRAKDLADKVSGGLGMAGKYGPAATVAKVSGVQARYEGARKGVTSLAEKYVTKPLRRHEEDVTARWQAKFGDRGAVEALQRTRIKEQMKKFEDEGLSVADMKTRFAGAQPGSNEYFALGQALLKEGALDGAQMEQLSARAAALGPTGANALRQAITRKMTEMAKEKKFSSPDDAAKAFLALKSENDQEKFLRDLKKNDIVTYALVASDPAIRTFIQLNPKLGATTGDAILRENLSRIDAENFGKAADAATRNGWALGSEFDARRDELLGEKGNYFKLLDNAPASQKAGIVRRASELKATEQRKEQEKAVTQAEAGVLAQERLEAEREDRARQARGGGRTP